MLKTVYQKFGKRGIDVFLANLGIIFLWPFFLFLSALIKISSPGPTILKLKRVGKNGKIFTFYKFRTMVKNAEKLKEKIAHLNEADGPVFKIRNDPRFTKLGKFLSHTGLDEIAQLVNILKGEMSFVGPRPLPVQEEIQITKKWQKKRRRVKPGIACSWLLKGAHSLSFSQWMKLDLEDMEKSSFLYDLKILSQTILLGLRLVKRQLKGNNHFPFPEKTQAKTRSASDWL